MKYIISTMLLSILIFTGCTNTPSTPNAMAKLTKTELIQKANNGNLKAMIELNRVYLFPQTKEGFDFYKSWYKLVLKSKNSEDILAFAKIFKQYRDMFINGDLKYAMLLEQAKKLGNSEALYKLYNFYYYKMHDEIRKQKLEDDIYKKPTLDSLMALYKVHTDYCDTIQIKKIENLIKKNKFTLNTTQKFYRYKFAFCNKDQKLQNKILKEILESKDTKAQNLTGKYLYKHYKDKKAQKYFERAVKLNPKDKSSYKMLAKVYKKLYRRQKRLDTLMSAALLDDYDSTKKALDIYKKLEHDKIYTDFITSILKLNEAKRALADFYFQNKRRVKADKLLDQLAKKGNDQAIIALASRVKLQYKDINETHLDITKKWQDFVLNSDKPYLVSMLRKRLKNYRKNLLVKLRASLKQKELDQNNIITLREVYKKAYRNKKLKKSYADKLIAFGDVKTILDVASWDLYKKRYKRGFALYEDLSQKGDIKATLRLAAFYTSYKKEQKDLKKALKYFERAYKQGDSKSLEKVTFYYLCGKCYGKKKADFINLQKAEPYIAKMLETKNTLNIYKIASVFQRGYYVKKDLARAIKYFKLLLKLKDYTAYYDLSQIYKYEYKDVKTSLMYTKKGVKLGNPTCITQLAYFYQVGYGVKKDINKAIELYKQVAHEQPFASYTVGMHYFLYKDYKQARKYLEMGIEKEGWKGATEQRAKVELELGSIYEKGLGVPADVKKALEFYKNAYNYILQYPNSTERKISAYNIAQIYHHGKGAIKKNLRKAKEWYKKSNTPQAKNELKKLGGF